MALMTLITNKFNYKTIQRKSVDGKRKYLTPDGHAVASVTTILDATKDKTHLIHTQTQRRLLRCDNILTPKELVDFMLSDIR